MTQPAFGSGRVCWRVPRALSADAPLAFIPLRDVIAVVFGRSQRTSRSLRGR
jgi:hypothetical protein